MQNTEHRTQNSESTFGGSRRNEIGAALASCFGLGQLPLAPGTWGSIPPAVIFGLICYLGASSVLAAAVMAVLALIGSVVCVRFAPVVIAATGKTDPRQVVADEFAGQAVTFLVSPFPAIGPVSTTGLWGTVLVGFLLFRFFDILKPWPIRKIEKLPAGWGILFDDILAGIYAVVALQICVRLWPSLIH